MSDLDFLHLDDNPLFDFTSLASCAISDELQASAIALAEAEGRSIEAPVKG